MTIHTKHEPGMFSWTDLSTNDPAAAKKFYAQLFDWTMVDVPMSEGAVYSICKRGEHDAAAISPLNEMQKRMKARPHWTCYFTVADVDAAAAKAEPAGGKRSWRRWT